MIRKDRVFANMFDSPHIIPARLVIFSQYVAAGLAALPDSATYASLIVAINTAIGNISKEGDDVNVNLIDQKNDTAAAKALRTGLGAFMKDNKMTIGAAMGGEQSAGYKAFYPFGVSEYTRATNTAMAALTMRLQTVTKKYGAKLSPDIAAALSGFKQGWEDAYSKQQGQISTVQIDRTQHSAAYTQLQLVMTQAVHKVGFENPGNEELGKKLFPFYLLYTPARKNSLELTGALATGESSNLLNRRLPVTVSLLVHNMENNSDICLWQGITADGAPPVKAFVVKAGETKKIRASRLGDLTGTFLMIANMSAANGARYEITVSGLPKDRKPKMQVVKNAAARQKEEQESATA